MPNRLIFTPQTVDNSRKLVEEGLWTLRLREFRSAVSSKGDSINYNPVFEIVSGDNGVPAPKLDNGNPLDIWYTGNSKYKNGLGLQEFCHALGFPMEEVEENGQKGFALPGKWVPENEDDIGKCQYIGPLVGRTAKAYLIKGEDDKKRPKNLIKYFVCSVPNCAQRFPKVNHIDNLIK